MDAESKMLDPQPGATQNGAPGSGTATPRDEGNSKAIRYKIQYMNDAGEPIQEEEQYKPWPKLMSADDEEKTGSVLDIITYVTIREITVSTFVNSEDGAKAAGSDSKEFTKEDSTKETDMMSAKSNNLKNKNLEIKSVGETKMEIRSSALMKALRVLVDYYPSQQLTGNTIMVPEPYHFLLHHREGLLQALNPQAEKCKNEYIRETPDKKTGDHIQILLAFLDSKYAKRIEEEEARHKKNPPTVTFEMLWMLLKPGTRVFHDVDGQLAAFVVKSVQPNKPSNPSSYDVELWSLDFDGLHVGRCKKDVKVASFSGEREVASLKIFPVDLVPDKSRLHELSTAGERYLDILRNGHQQVNYEGHTLGSAKRQHKGRVVLDPASYWSYSETKLEPPYLGDVDDNSKSRAMSRCMCDICQDLRTLPKASRWASYDDIDPKNLKHKLTPEHFQLFPRKIPGFLLKSRTWDLLDINCASKCEPNETAIGNLVMNDSHLKLVKILTAQYGRNTAWSADFIRSKGEGQIFLLHGPPGVGKTYTAECIAESTRRPLLALTCADIGTDEKAIEATLSAWFSLAEIWGAVMLIDEADIYLEIRSSGDMQRCSLVSAFLRSMEYYRGILFLTTNRVGHIDDAIMSRVHLVVRYEPLKPAARKKIWAQFVEKLMEDRQDFMVEPRATAYIEAFFEDTDIEWNGREIRNAIQTAVALADHEAKTANPQPETVKLKTAHIKDVVEMSQIFKKYLTDFKGDEAERALKERARMDKDKHLKKDPAAELRATRERAAG